MLFRIGVVTESTQIAAVDHESPLLHQQLRSEDFDIGTDMSFSSSCMLEVKDADKPTCDVIWSLLRDQYMFNVIPPLQEVKAVEHGRLIG